MIYLVAFIMLTINLVVLYLCRDCLQRLDVAINTFNDQLRIMESLVITCHKAADVIKSHQESVEKLHNTVEIVKQGNKRAVR